MAFFDDISKKFSQASQNAVQKGKDINEIVKTNGAISTEEKNINSLCLQIGKLYITKHSDDCEAEFKPFVDAVIKSQKAIEEYRQKVMMLKGVTICEKCGSEIAKNAAFCSACGAPAPKQQLNNVAVCYACGQPIENEAKFCMNCGASTAQNIPTPEDAPTAPQTQAATLCANCGNAVALGTLFCTNCGAPISSKSAPVAVEPIQTVAETVQEAPANVCANCSAPLADGVLFCTSCGARVAQEETVSSANICPNCGNAVAEEMMFCTSCGFKMK